MATAAAVPLHVVSSISQSRVGERGGCRDACLQISALSSSWPSGEAARRRITAGWQSCCREELASPPNRNPVRVGTRQMPY